MAKPDDRSDNVDKLQNMAHNTEEKMNEAQDFLAAHGDEMNQQDKEDLQEKNKRRMESMEGFRDEIRDEQQDRQ